MKRFQLLAALAACVLLFLPPRASYPQATIQPLLNNGATAKRINIVILSEGYTSPELSKYWSDANTMLHKLLETPPFKEYNGYFNAFAIAVASNESGADHPSRNLFRNTFFHSTYDSFGIQRLITITAAGRARVDSLLQLLMPEYDLVIMIVNDPEYGGSGGFPAVTSINTNAPEIVVHELGHSFAGLGDEYADPYPGYPDNEEPNTTRETRRNSIKWREWILDGTPIQTPNSPQYAAVIGLFEGAHYHDTGWFRPKRDCKMRVLGVDFCEVCAEALVKSEYELIPPIESFSPAATNIAFVGAESISLSIVPLQPSKHALSIQWHVDGTAVNGATSPSFLVSATALGNGRHEVKVKVVDNTNLVRNDPARLLSDSTSWTITVSTVTAVTEAPQPQMPQQYWLEQNYPNPMSTSARNSVTTIRYALPRATHVKLAVYNVRGQPVAELVNAEKQAGVHQAQLEIGRLANGIYFYRLQAGEFVQTRKLILFR
jgi:IgA Peptidase M64/Secretion system C-terminal sorting domain